MNTTSFSSCENHMTTVQAPVPSDFLHKIMLIAYPFLFTVGTIGNGLSFLVLHPFGTRISGHVYLACLAVFDTLSLLFYVISFWSILILRPFLLQRSDYSAVKMIDYYLLTAGVCEIRIYLTFTVRMLSVWTVVILTMERFLLIVSPLRFYKFLRPKIAWITMGVSCLVIGAMNLPWLFSFSYIPKLDCTQKQYKLCVPNKVFRHCFFAEFVLITIVPAILLIVANVKIAFTLAKRRQLWISRQTLIPRHRLLNIRLSATSFAENMEGTLTGVVTRSHLEAQQQERQLMMRLFLVSLVFCVLSLPSLIFVSLVTFKEYYNAQSHRHGLLADAFHISLFLFALNLTINFIIYCIIGKTFRRAIWALITCNLGLFLHLRAALISGTEITCEFIESSTQNIRSLKHTEEPIGNVPCVLEANMKIQKDIQPLSIDIPYLDS